MMKITKVDNPAFPLAQIIPNFSEERLSIKTVHLFIILLLQIVLQNQISFYPRALDLVSAWLIITILIYPSLYICFLGVVGGFFIEVHANLPQYQVMSTYWSMLGALLVVRKKIALTNPGAWLTLLLITHLWILFIELSVLFTQQTLTQESFKELILIFLLRTMLSLIIITLNKNHIINTAHSEE
jgi:hypothetical protein